MVEYPQMLSYYMIDMEGMKLCEQWIMDYWWGNYEPIEDEM